MLTDVELLQLFFYSQMEGLIREMQDPENGVPVRSQKLFLTSIPSAFMGRFIIIIIDIYILLVLSFNTSSLIPPNPPTPVPRSSFTFKLTFCC